MVHDPSPPPVPPQPGHPEQETTRTATPSGEPGGSIGPYRLLQKIGEGGMGEVWLAEQVTPIRRKVALKVIKAGMDTKQVVARFEAERQALALMSHPCIARVFDAGETPRGLPFFAMEHVQGEAITTYCDRHRLPNADRLALFMRVCDGVQHAHQKGIIHRDLKPSNILVTIEDNEPVPKVIDFGVAKATAWRLTEKTVFTEMGALIGTPEYMSPEQAEMTGLDVDTRTDVYALGMVLYELLVGALPFDVRDLRRAGLEGIRRQIREVEPPRPSTRAGSLGKASALSAQNRRTEPGRLAGQLAGDLDWITMRALEKDRTRRYSSPNDLAVDISRHLRDEPVLAGPPSTTYRVGKFVRRHRVGVAAVALVLLALIGFATMMTVQAARIAKERNRAERISAFLISLFEASAPVNSRGKEITARELLDRGRERIERELGDDPEVSASLLDTVGFVYLQLGQYESSEQLLSRALDLRRATLGDDNLDTIHSMFVLGSDYYWQGRNDEAEVLYKEAVTRLRRLRGDDKETVDALTGLSSVYEAQHRYDESESLWRETLARMRLERGENDALTLAAMWRLGRVVLMQGRLEEAEQLHRAALEGRRRLLGADDHDTLMSMDWVASVLKAEGRHDEAAALYREVLDTRRRILGADHPDTIFAMERLVDGLTASGSLVEAEDLARQYLEATRRVKGPDHPDVPRALDRLAAIYLNVGRPDDAERILAEALTQSRRLLGDSNPQTLGDLYNLACVEASRGRPVRALEYLSDAVTHGYADGDAMLADEDLESLHGNPGFDALVARARLNLPTRK